MGGGDDAGFVGVTIINTYIYIYIYTLSLYSFSVVLWCRTSILLLAIVQPRPQSWPSLWNQTFLRPFRIHLPRPLNRP